MSKPRSRSGTTERSTRGRAPDVPVPLRRKVARRTRAVTRFAGFALTECRLRLRWLGWRFRRRFSADDAEPARGFRFTPNWCKRAAAANGALEEAWCSLVHQRFPALPAKVNGLDDDTTATLRFHLHDLAPQAFVACIPRGRVVGDCGDVI